MLLIPAIDLKEGRCVRLKQGLMEQATVFSDSPAETALHWFKQGARRSAKFSRHQGHPRCCCQRHSRTAGRRNT